eukprot:CAMPEP_0197842142 /NCGR_PEP_ID=MMETSP1437-20131217/46574_1 /TAXON_ID=49252 ORGANISM="Eucampia antarctica, Strain CCMP1452" /NCGR_SAMPLE_ID=MMETSP1437 /ASSEMBLY_ACC=CAM_ASM_001096 /LENGTH=213 /DNA_ID=CAMNT_0043451983 /DNA_START=793 /DNA_END=1434 /DNA_ORIENTATION=-
MSQETETYDLLEASSMKWLTFNRATLQLADIDFFSLLCDECTNCSGGGICSDNKCECNSGVYGSNCEFDLSCGELSESKERKPFFGNNTTPFNITDASYNISSHDRPVFYRVNDGKIFDVIVFDGRRWVLTRANYVEGMDQVTFLKKVVDSFGDLTIEYAPTYLSSPITYGSSSDNGTPKFISWFDATMLTLTYEVDASSSVDTEFNKSDTCD